MTHTCHECGHSYVDRPPVTPKRVLSARILAHAIETLMSAAFEVGQVDEARLHASTRLNEDTSTPIMTRARLMIAAKAYYKARLGITDAILDECEGRNKHVVTVPVGE